MLPRGLFLRVYFLSESDKMLITLCLFFKLEEVSRALAADWVEFPLVAPASFFVVDSFLLLVFSRA